MKIKILIILLAFITLCLGITIYLNQVFIPIKVKARLIQFLEEKTKRKVQIGSINYNLLKGIVLRQIIISEENLQDHFLNIEEINFNPQILPIIQKKIIIPAINIQSPDISLIWLAKNSWNFSSLIPTQKQPQANKQKFSLVVLKINIVNGKTNFIDKTGGQEFQKTVENLNISANLFFDALTLNANFSIKETSYNTRAALRAKFNFRSKTLNTAASLIKINPAEYNQYIPQTNFTLEKCFIDNIKINLFYAIENNNFTANINSNIKDTALKTKNIIFNSNNLYLETNLEKNNADFNYSGFIDLENAAIKNIPGIGDISAITGKLSFSTDKLSSNNLSAITNFIPINLKGELTNFKNPNIKAVILSQFDLKDIQNKLPKNISSKLEKFEGKALVKLNILGPLDTILSNIRGDINISDGNIKLSNSRLPLEAVQGDIKFQKNQINANINSSILKLTTNINVNEKVIQIPNLKMQFLNSTLLLKDGQLDFTSSKNQNINLNGELNLKLSDLKTFLPKFPDKIQGDLTGDITIGGNFNKFQNLNLQASLFSDLITVFDFKLNNVGITYKQNVSSISNLNIAALAYQGNINLSVQGQFVDNAIDYQGGLEIQNVQLNELIKDTSAKQKDIRGNLNSKAVFQGTTKGLNYLEGQGLILVTDGYLWELNLFKGLSQVLSIVNFDKIIFKDAGCNFNIKDKVLYTDNLQLVSQQVTLLAQGSLGFDGKLDFTIQSQMMQSSIASTSPNKLEQILGTIVGVATNTFSARLTGTIKEPKYKVLPISPESIFRGFKNITDIFSN